MRTTSEQEKLLLAHQRLGHPSFSLWKEMYSNIFGKLNIENIVCDTCQIAKLKRTLYQVVNNKCQLPFQLIRRDIWGPSPYIGLYTDLDG